MQKNKSKSKVVDVKEFKEVSESKEVKEVKVNTITEQDVLDAIKEITPLTINKKATVVAVELKNGFILVESSACVDPANYDMELGIKICLDKIYDKIWELLGFKLQQELYERKVMEDALEEI